MNSRHVSGFEVVGQLKMHLRLLRNGAMVVRLETIPAIAALGRQALCHLVPRPGMETDRLRFLLTRLDPIGLSAPPQLLPFGKSRCLRKK